MIAQEKKIKDLVSNIKKIKYIIKDYCSIIEHSRVDKNNNNLKLMQSMKLSDSEVFKDNKEVQINQWLIVMRNKLTENVDYYFTE